MFGHGVWLSGHDWAEKVFRVKNTGLGGTYQTDLSLTLWTDVSWPGNLPQDRGPVFSSVNGKFGLD